MYVLGLTKALRKPQPRRRRTIETNFVTSTTAELHVFLADRGFVRFRFIFRGLELPNETIWPTDILPESILNFRLVISSDAEIWLRLVLPCLIIAIQTFFS